MSEKTGKFQSKSRKFGQGGKGRGRPGGGGFGKRFEGDRDGHRVGGGKHFRDRGDKGESFGRGERKPRFEGRDSGGSEGSGERKPFKKREWSNDRPQGGGDRPQGGGDRPRGEFRRDGGDRPFKKNFRDRDDRGGDRGGDRPYKKPFRDRDDRGGDHGGDRPYKKPFRDRDDRGGAPGGDRPYKKPFRDSDRDGGFGERRERPVDSRVRDKGDRHKPYQRNFDDRQKKSFRVDAPPPQDLPQYAEGVIEVSPNEAASVETRQKLKSDRPGYGSPSSAFLYGTHAVRAALQNPRRVMQRLLVTENGFENIREAHELARNTGIKVPEPVYVEPYDIERLLPRDAVHQGVLLDAQPPEEVFLADVLIAAPEHAKLLVLDQVTDPHNVGAILRSAAAFGVSAVVMQKLHAPDITGTLAKSASGAVEHVPLVREVNLSRAIEQIKEAGFFCVGLAEEAKDTLAVLAPTGKTCLVLGAEGEGLRRLVAESCDTLAKLPTSGPISSLNVSNAAAVALYELSRGA